MGAAVIVIDGGSIENLFVMGGRAAWDQLIKGSEHIVVSDVIMAELRAGPAATIAADFELWARGKSGVSFVSYNPEGVSLNNLPANTNYGDKVLRDLIGRNANVAAANFLTAAGVPLDGDFRLLSDDGKFIGNVNSAPKAEGGTKALGHARNPYASSADFIAERVLTGDLEGATGRGWLQAFKASPRFTSLNSDLRIFVDNIINQVDSLEPSVFSKIKNAVGNLVAASEGSASPHFALKGGALAGALVLSKKFGLIGDVLAFAATASKAEELRAQGQISESNKLWTTYLYQTGGALAGTITGVGLTTYISKGKGGFWAPLVGGLVGGVIGSLAGAPLGAVLYDLNPSLFDSFFNAVYNFADRLIVEGETVADNYALALLQALGFSADPAKASDGNDWLLGTKWQHISGGEGDDLMVGWKPLAVKAGEHVDPTNQNSDVAKSDFTMTLDGGEGKDWVLAIGGDKAVTVGGLGRDWIYNSSDGGIIWGDVKDSVVDPVTGQRFVLIDSLDAEGNPTKIKQFIADDKSNGDNIWYAGGTTLMDAQRHDVLKFYGIPLTGGSEDGGLLLNLAGAVTGGLGAAAGVALAASGIGVHPLKSQYFDHILPFLRYHFEVQGDGSYDLVIDNLLDKAVDAIAALFGDSSQSLGALVNAQGGEMRIKDFIPANLHGNFAVSYLGGSSRRAAAAANDNDNSAWRAATFCWIGVAGRSVA